MKKIFRWIGIILGVIVIAAASIAAYIHFSGFPSYDVQTITSKVESTPARIERGRTLAMMLCVECHRNAETQLLTGTQLKDLPEEFGVAYSRNITQHPTKGIGQWSDGELLWLLRTGIHPKTGKYLPPWMPKFIRMSDEDLHSIIAFLRSDDPMVQPADVDNIESQPSFLAKFLARVAFKPFEYPSAPIAPPDTNNPIEHGKYLANGVFDCYACHSGDFKTMNVFSPELSGDYYAGGNKMLDVNRMLVPSVNITPDKETGIGNWTEQDFINAMKTGFRPDGSLMRYPMGRFHRLTDTEIRHIYAFLRTVPPIKKANMKAENVQPSSSATLGEKQYIQYGCVGCHGTTGLGYADLQKAHKKYPSDSVLADVILHPKIYFGPLTTMPTWEGRINPNHVPNIVAHVRELGKKSGQ